MHNMSIINNAKSVIQTEIEALSDLLQSVDESMAVAVKLIEECSGRVIITGMGKSGIIARKIAATMSSTGTAAFFLNPAEGIHGDLGLIMRNDVVIAISKGGETDEVNRIIPLVKRQGNSIIAITAHPKSTLAHNADCVLLIGTTAEACPFNLAPTSSTTATLALGDALAIALLQQKGFTEKDFAMLHPGGSLGRKFITVEDIMYGADEKLPIVSSDTIMTDVLKVMISKNKRGHIWGLALITDNNNAIQGIIVDGDLKRLLLGNAKVDLSQLKVCDVMTKNPKTIQKKALANEALHHMEGKITSLVVVNDNNQPEGIVHIHDILGAKIA